MTKFITITDAQAAQIAAAELNRCSFELAFLGATPGAHIVHKPEVTYVASGFPDVSLNKVCRTHTDDDHVISVIDDALSYFKQDETPFSWIIGPSSRPLKLDKALKYHGFLYDHDETGLIIDLAQVARHEVPSSYMVKRCANKDEIADFCYVQGWAGSSEAHQALWNRMLHVDWNDLPLLELYVCYRNNEPVAAGIAVPYAGVMGLYAVTFLDGEQDAGRALIQEVLSKSQGRGYQVAVTYTERNLLDVYRIVGFKPLCAYQIWIMQEYRQQYESRYR
ncbi:MAG: hypothetical protein KJZ77_19050 [Anaerolineales bacterium]|nr:hypothetical protein [Anaerolineales bacterium]